MTQHNQRLGLVGIGDLAAGGSGFGRLASPRCQRQFDLLQGAAALPGGGLAFPDQQVDGRDEFLFVEPRGGGFDDSRIIRDRTDQAAEGIHIRLPLPRSPKMPEPLFAVGLLCFRRSMTAHLTIPFSALVHEISFCDAIEMIADLAELEHWIPATLATPRVLESAHPPVERTRPMLLKSPALEPGDREAVARMS